MWFCFLFPTFLIINQTESKNSKLAKRKLSITLFGANQWKWQVGVLVIPDLNAILFYFPIYRDILNLLKKKNCLLVGNLPVQGYLDKQSWESAYSGQAWESTTKKQTELDPNFNLLNQNTAYDMSCVRFQYKINWDCNRQWSTVDEKKNLPKSRCKIYNSTLKLKPSICRNPLRASLPRFGCFENILLVIFKFLYAFSDVIHGSVFIVLRRGFLIICVSDDSENE